MTPSGREEGQDGAPVFANVFDENRDRIYRLVLTLIPNAADAEDITQRVFLQAYRAFGSFRGDSAVFTWLYRIAINVCANHVRNRSRRPEISPPPSPDSDDQDPLENREDPLPTVDQQAEKRESDHLLLQALSEIRQVYREVIILREFEDKTYQEIASILNVSVDVVGVRLIRARTQLKKILKDRL